MQWQVQVPSSPSLETVWHPGMSYEARVPNVTTEGQSSTIKRCSLTAFRFCQNQKSQQPAKALLQQQLPAGGVSVQAWQSWLLGSGVSADLCSVENKWLCARPRLLNEGNPCSSLPQANCKEPLEQGPYQPGFWAYSILQMLHPWHPVLYGFITKALQILQEIWTQESTIFCWHSKASQGKIISMWNLEREIIHTRQLLPVLKKII